MSTVAEIQEAVQKLTPQERAALAKAVLTDWLQSSEKPTMSRRLTGAMIAALERDVPASEPGGTAQGLLPEHWELILDKLAEPDPLCVAFLGAGASLGSKGQPGLPSASQLAHAMARRCEYPGPDPYDFLRVAQFFEEKREPYALRSFLCKQLDAKQAGVAPTAVHRIIARLPFRYVLTTNFDELMEEAYADPQVNKKPQVCYYRRFGPMEALPPATAQTPVVYKLHGTIKDWESMVVTEHDVVEFMSCVFLQKPPLPDVIRGLFKTHSVLFIGYGLKDWNVRVLIQAIRNGERGTRCGIKSYAVQRRPNCPPGLGREWDSLVEFWDKQANLVCANMDATEFASALEQQTRQRGLIP